MRTCAEFPARARAAWQLLRIHIDQAGIEFSTQGKIAVVS
jgi:hypothetical protein